MMIGIRRSVCALASLDSMRKPSHPIPHERPEPRRLHAVIAAALVLATGCDCRSDSQPGSPPIVIVAEPGRGAAEPDSPSPAITDAGPDARLMAGGRLPLVALHELDVDERRVVDKIIRILKRYYPSWDGDPDSLDAFYQHWYETPETRRFMAKIERRVKNDRIWAVLFDDVQRALGRTYWVQSGSPPGFYVPSFIVVITTREPRHATAVFRLSMLLPVYDYYEIIREPGQLAQVRLTPEDPDTKPVAEVMRRLIAEHYPWYREFPPRLGLVLIPSLRAENTFVGRTSLAELLFADDRNW